MRNLPNATSRPQRVGFSLVEVVIALGVVSVAIVAILGVFPIALQTSHSAQDDTRAAHIAQTIFASLASQKFNAVSIKLYDSSGSGTPSSSIDLDLTLQNGAGPNLSANNKGEVFVPGNPPAFFNPPSAPVDTSATYGVTLLFNNSPTGFDAQFANEVAVSVAWPAAALPANQTKRSFVRIISKY